MWRVLTVSCALVFAAGCRTPESNPFAAFGPSTIPPPTIEMPANGSYYTTPGAAGTAAPPTNSLSSISVPSGASVPQPAAPLPATPHPSVPRPYSFGSLAPRGATSPSFTTDPSDREPIRIVEAAPNEARVATAPARTNAPGVVEAAPAARDPIRAFNSSTNRGAIEPYVPTFAQPPAGGFKSSGRFRTDGAIQPTAYLQATAANIESADAGGWRSR